MSPRSGRPLEAAVARRWTLFWAFAVLLLFVVPDIAQSRVHPNPPVNSPGHSPCIQCAADQLVEVDRNDSFNQPQMSQDAFQLQNASLARFLLGQTGNSVQRTPFLSKFLSKFLSRLDIVQSQPVQEALPPSAQTSLEQSMPIVTQGQEGAAVPVQVAETSEQEGSNQPSKQQSQSSRRWLESDWVSSRDPPPGFEAWLDFASERQCHMGRYEQIEASLAAFVDENNSQKLRITKEQIQKAGDMLWCTTWIVADGRLSYVPSDRIRDWDIPRFHHIVQNFVHLLPDMRFVINSQDEPRVLPGQYPDLDAGFAECQNASKAFREHRHLHGFVNNRQSGEDWDVNRELVPLFTQTTVNGCFKDILFPTLFGMENTILTSEQDAQLIPWAQRSPNLFWRGSTTGGGFFKPQQHRMSHRHRLVKLAKEKPNMDIGFTRTDACEQSVCKEMIKEYGMKPTVNEMENFKHKWLISIDGNTFVSRLPKFMSSGSLNIRVGMFDEWFDMMVEEGKHYIRVGLDFADLDEKLQWAAENDEQAMLIGRQARQFAKSRLRNEDMECYMYRLLLEYAAICDK